MHKLTAGLLLFWFAALPLHAEIYKHVDDKGRVTYSNEPIKGGKKVDLPPLSTVPPPSKAESKPDPKAAANPAAAPANTDNQRKALMEAIAQEEKALEDAKKAAKEGANHPETFKRTRTVTGADGKPQQITETGRNVAAYEEKMKKLNENVAAHEEKLTKLKAELAALDAPKDTKK